MIQFNVHRIQSCLETVHHTQKTHFPFQFQNRLIAWSLPLSKLVMALHLFHWARLIFLLLLVTTIQLYSSMVWRSLEKICWPGWRGVWSKKRQWGLWATNMIQHVPVSPVHQYLLLFTHSLSTSFGLERQVSNTAFWVPPAHTAASSIWTASSWDLNALRAFTLHFFTALTLPMCIPISGVVCIYLKHLE